MQLDTQLDMHFHQYQLDLLENFLWVKTLEIFQFPKHLPSIGIQVLGIGHPVVCIKTPGQKTSSSPQGTGHTFWHLTPSTPSAAIFGLNDKCFTY